MKSVNNKIALLREEMKKNSVLAYIIPSADPHMSEYLPSHWELRRYFSGFNGSAGTLVITEKESGLWTDGRYFIQAENQLKGSEIKLFRMAEKDVPTYIEFLSDCLQKEESVGFDGKLIAASVVQEMEIAFAEKQLKIKAVDLIGSIWEERPDIPATEVYVHDVKYTGYLCKEKLDLVREQLKAKKAEGTVITKLDSVAWLMNLRADDIAYNPLVIAYASVYLESAYLFVNTNRVPQQVLAYLKENGVTVLQYEDIEQHLQQINAKKVLLCNLQTINYNLYRILEENKTVTVVKDDDIVTNLKGVKNPTEIENIIHAHVKDGCAMVKFKVKFDEMAANGDTITECTVADLLKKFRSEQADNKGESFDTIAAYLKNAAMMHYHPHPENCKIIGRKGFLLVDSGAQFLDGTTDITRTFAMGELTEEERLHYTYVIKSHIGLATAVFMEGCTGGNLDILARRPIWMHGLDYRCGTGHGVGFLSGVHEGPQNMRISNQVALKAGMTITDEPGIYIEGKHGIRTENELLVADYMTTEYGRFFHFEVITFFPIETAPIKVELLTEEERNWLNDYHKLVFEKLSPHLEGKELEWLKENTQLLKR